ncbi:MAG: hypothetical protein ACLGHN_01695 [Bacteriovoracia bacterium]
MRIFAILLLFVFVTSCGKSNSRAGYPREEYKPVFLPADGSNISGLYMAKFQTLNTQVNGSTPGSATLYKKEDKFYAYVRLFGGGPKTWHQQNVHEGTRCPDLSDDLNGDGYIDIEEGNRVWGKILLPLDSNISSQKSGRNIYPIADEAGSYFYERVTTFDKMFQDLKSSDKNLEDDFRKLLPNEGLDFTGKVAVVLGTSDTVIYPETVASADNRPVYQTFPVACGVFERVTQVPGEAHTDEIPGPIEEVGPEEDTTVPDGDMSDGESEDPEYDERQPPREEEEEDRWYDRVIDWWRNVWERDRRNRRQIWGDGRRWPFF